MKRSARGRALLSGILLAAVALRLYQLGSQSLWYDETVSVALGGSPWPELLRHTAGDIHPPGYYALLRLWLLATGYGAGAAGAAPGRLEFVAQCFSVGFDLLVIALAFAVARRLTDRRTALLTAVLLALSPYHIWYSQEVRMYTLAAALGLLALYALIRTLAPNPRRRAAWWLTYAAAAGLGMYVLYYFIFLLMAVNAWVALRYATGRLRPARRIAAPATATPVRPWLIANGLTLALYAPWLGVAWRQATQPPVPPWRTTQGLWTMAVESWTALSFGQSAPRWVWPALLLTAALYALGVLALRRGRNGGHTQRNAGEVAATLLPAATFGPLALIWLLSLLTPLYHVRYLFTYSPAFYIVLAAGLTWLLRRARWAALGFLALWIGLSAASLHAFWRAPAFQTDDHRSAVAFLQQHWRPGDVVIVNAGWAYTALTTYWQGEIERTRLTDPLPTPRADDDLIVVTTGHIDGEAGLGWGDPRSDFFALPAASAESQIAALYERFGRVWHYRIYDTVNDPHGLVRAALAEGGRLVEDRTFAGEANMRVQAYLPLAPAAPPADWPAALLANALELRRGPVADRVTSGEQLFIPVAWRFTATGRAFAASVRLLDRQGIVWAQGTDEQPAGPEYGAARWPAAAWTPQVLALPIPAGTAPGDYTIELVVYDPQTGQSWPCRAEPQPPLTASANGIALATVTLERASAAPAAAHALATFGPLALLQASTPVTRLTSGGEIPIELLWQATVAPAEPLVVVAQLQAADGRLVAALEAEPLQGRYPTQRWQAGELVRDRHTVTLPTVTSPGPHRLIIGVYRAADRQRLRTRAGLLGTSDHWLIKTIVVE